MNTTCPRSDLAATQCAHCRGDVLPDGVIPDILTLDGPAYQLRRTIAWDRFATCYDNRNATCSECGCRIPPGHRTWIAGGVVCDGCFR